MVHGSPRHFPSNGGVERLNRTMEEKLGAWMAETGSTNWSISCRLMMWRYNTQEHRTVGNVPYHLVSGQMPRVGISSLHLSATVLDILATEAQLNRVCDYAGKEAEAIDNPVAADGDEMEEDAEATADLAMGEDEVENAVANNILCPEITVGAVAVGVAIAEMVTEAIDVDEEFVEGNPDDDNGSEGEGVPVAEVVRDEVSVDASVAGNLKVSEHNNEMSTWETSVQNLPIDFVLNVDFLWNLASVCQYLPTDRQTDRPQDRPTARPIDRQTDRHTTDRPTARPADRPTARPTDAVWCKPMCVKNVLNVTFLRCFFLRSSLAIFT
jgi:hypothetical protein